MQLFLPFRSWEEGEWQKKEEKSLQERSLSPFRKRERKRELKVSEKKECTQKKVCLRECKMFFPFLPPSLVRLSRKWATAAAFAKNGGKESRRDIINPGPHSPSLGLPVWPTFDAFFYSPLGKKCCIPAAEEICNCPPSPPLSPWV